MQPGLRSIVSPLLLLALTCAAAYSDQPPGRVAEAATQHWSSLITAKALNERSGHPNLLIIDARSPKEYAAGHIPGAINLPGAEWRTPPAKPGSGQIGQRIFRKDDGTVDVERYEKFLSTAGVKPEHEIVVYGNYAGKADGSIPAAILLKLGHENVAFLDGVGIDEWRKAGYQVSTEATKLPPSKYTAHPDLKRLWSREDVLKNLDNPDVIIIDSRTPEEFAGADLRGNKRGGHIPGAILLNAEEFLDKTSHTTIDAEAAREKIEAAVPKDKTVVIYCQSGTRCSHKELMLKDLGYKHVVLYDASWQEWGNCEDTPVENDKLEAPATPAFNSQ